MPPGAGARHTAHGQLPQPPPAGCMRQPPPTASMAAPPQGDAAVKTTAARAGAASAAAVAPEAASGTAAAAAARLGAATRGVPATAPGPPPRPLPPTAWTARAAATLHQASAAPTTAPPGAAARAAVVQIAAASDPPIPRWPPAGGSDLLVSALPPPPAQQPAPLGIGTSPSPPWTPLTGFGWPPPLAPPGDNAGALGGRASIIPGAPVPVACPSSRPAPPITPPAAAATRTPAAAAPPSPPLNGVNQGPSQAAFVSAAAGGQSRQASGPSAAKTVAKIIGALNQQILVTDMWRPRSPSPSSTFTAVPRHLSLFVLAIGHCLATGPSGRAPVTRR